MKAGRASLFVLVLLVLSACTATRITNDMSVSHPRFLVDVTPPGSTNWTWIESRTVPCTPDQAFWWSIDVRTPRTNSTWVAIDQYPSSDWQWTHLTTNLVYELSIDRTRLTYPPEPLPRDGVLYRLNFVSKGDPPGDYATIIILDNVPVHIFHYSLVEEKNASNRVLVTD